MNSLLRVFGPVNNLAHGYQIAGVVVACGAVFMAAYGLSVAGLLEMGASAFVFWFMQFVSLLGPNLSRKVPKEFAKSASMMDQFIADLVEFRKGQRVFAQALMALGATILFLICRFLCASILPLITNVWFAGAIGLAVCSIVISPLVFRGLLATMRGSSRITGGDDVA